jgi:acyl-CoA synthetase (NDP forming)
LAATAEDACALARGFGGPVALKIASPDIAHKSDVGGVLLGLRGDEAVAAGHTRILAQVAAAAPDARIDGVLVSPMVEGGVEMIVGLRRDPAFGPVLLCGMGGLFVEIHKDVVVRLAPFGPRAALEMIRSVAGFALLDGARGRPRCDIEALAQALSRLSAYADHFRDGFDSLEINPLIVLPAGRGVVAVDALVVPRQEEFEK